MRVISFSGPINTFRNYKDTCKYTLNSPHADSEGQSAVVDGGGSGGHQHGGSPQLGLHRPHDTRQLQSHTRGTSLSLCMFWHCCIPTVNEMRERTVQGERGLKERWLHCGDLCVSIIPSTTQAGEYVILTGAGETEGYRPGQSLVNPNSTVFFCLTVSILFRPWPPPSDVRE